MSDFCDHVLEAYSNIPQRSRVRSASPCQSRGQRLSPADQGMAGRNLVVLHLLLAVCALEQHSEQGP